MKPGDTYHFQQVSRKYFALLEVIVHEHGLETHSFSEHGGYQYAVVEAPVGGVEHPSAVLVVVGLAVVGLVVVVGGQPRLFLQSLFGAVTH